MDGRQDQMSEGSPAEASLSEGEDGFFAEEDLTDEEEDNEDEENDSDDVLEDLDGPLGRIGMEGSDSDIEYGREGYFYPFDNDLILNGQHRDRYGTGNSYKLSVPRSGHGNAWLHVFSAALSKNRDTVQRELRHKADFGETGSLLPQHRDFPVHCTPTAMSELKMNIGHHICDCKYVPHTYSTELLPMCVITHSYLVSWHMMQYHMWLQHSLYNPVTSVPLCSCL